MGREMSESGKGQEENRPSTDAASGYVRLDAWRFADDLAVELFQLTKNLPGDVRWLMTQVVRAATSAPANIAEGYGRASNREFLQHLAVAHGSLYEVEYYLHFMRRTQILDHAKCASMTEKCRRASRTVYGLMKAVRSDAFERPSKRRYLRESPEVYAAIDND